MGESPRSFEITVEGQYYGVHDSTGTPAVKKYIAKFLLPSQEAALSVICKHLLDPYLRKHFPDYAKFRSHKITSIVTNGRPADPKVLQMAFEDMDIRDLADFCILKQILVDPYKHESLEKCKEVVRGIWEGRVAQQKADQKTGAAKEKKEVDELMSLNKLTAPVEAENPNATKINAAAEKGKKAEEPKADEEDLLG
jgi:hypothetical protein